MRYRFLTASAIVLAAASVYPQNLEGLAPYQAEKKVNGSIRNYGNNIVEPLLKLWEAGFRKHQPAVRFGDNMPSSAAAMAGLYTGIADLAHMGREIWPIEVVAFHRVFQYEPLEITVATGSFDVTDYTWGLAVFVHKDNPVSRLTLKQLDGIFGAARIGGRRGMTWDAAAARTEKDDIRTWGQLGLTGDWANKPIQTYGFDLALSGFPVAFERLVFQGGDKWNPNLREYVHAPRAALDGGDRMMTDLASDRYGIAFSGMQFGRRFASQVKPVALAVREGGPYVEPTRDSYANRTYPLVRDIYIYVNRAPGVPLEPRLKEFLKYVLSREGQSDVAREGNYLPLTAEVVREQLKKLE